MPRNRIARPSDPRTVYWLIAGHEAGRAGLLTVGLDGGGETPPVFSFPDEAGMFLRLGGFEKDGWRTVACMAGELVSKLAEDRRPEVKLVALDPLPEMMDPMFGTTLALVTLSLRSFVERHAGGPEEKLVRPRNGSRRVAVGTLGPA